MSKYENKLNKAKKQVVKNIIDKTKNPSKKAVKPAKISENKEFLILLHNQYSSERKKISKYLAILNHNIKIIKGLLSEVK